MSNFLTETTNESFFSRIKNAIIGVFVGFFLIIVSIGVICWNEYRTIKETHRLEKGESLTNSDVSIDQIDSNLVGKLVHVKGKVHSDETLTDEKFGVSFQGISLNRTVQTYQWVEKKKTKSRKKLGGGKKRETTYEYEKEWVSRPVDSSDFKKPEGHENKPATFSGQRQFSENSTLGAFKFPGRLNGQLQAGSAVSVPKESLEKLKTEFPDAKWSNSSSELYFSLNGQSSSSAPAIGDQKISFKGLQDAAVTLISGQTEDSFQPFALGSSWANLELLEHGEISSEEVFQRARTRNSFWKWALRIGGFIAMWIGFSMLMRPIVVLGDVVPFIGSILGFGTAIIGFILAASISLITFAVAWFAVRPLLSGGILLAVCLLIGGIMYLRRSNTPPPKDHGVELVS